MTLENEAMESLADEVQARRSGHKALPAPEMPSGETRYPFSVVAARVSDCAQYLAQCQSKVEECDRNMTRATNELARATKAFSEARKIADQWTKQMQERLDEFS